MQLHEPIHVACQLAYAVLYSRESIIHVALKLADFYLNPCHALVEPLNILIGLIESLIDPTKTLINLTESSIDLAEPLINLTESLVDLAKTLIGLSKTTAYEALNVDEMLAYIGSVIDGTFFSHPGAT